MNITLKICPRCQKIPTVRKYYDFAELVQVQHICKGFGNGKIDVVGSPAACEKAWNVFADHIADEEKLLQPKTFKQE